MAFFTKRSLHSQGTKNKNVIHRVRSARSGRNGALDFEYSIYLGHSLFQLGPPKPVNNIYLRCYFVHCLNRLSCLVFVMAYQMQYYMNYFICTLKTKRFFPVSRNNSVTHITQQPSYWKNTATFCNMISAVFFVHYVRCDINWHETTMFWSKN